jgi:glycosyltransferase involved in cell wall biosynthesis
MSSLHRTKSLAIVSGPVGKTPADPSYSFVFNEARKLAEKGLEIHIIRQKREKMSISCGIRFHGLEKTVDVDIIKSAKLLSNYPPFSLLRNPAVIYWENLYALNVARIVEKNNLGLIHAHFAYPEGWAGLLAKKQTGQPLIVTLHGYDVNTVPEINYGIRLNEKLDLLVRRVLGNADAVVCVNSDLGRKALDLGTPNKKLFVVFNGVDLDLFRPLRGAISSEANTVRRLFGISENDFLILNARHLRPVYGLEYLIYAAKVVYSHVRNVKFLIAGDGDQQEKLSQLIKTLGLQETVKLIDYVPKALMPKLMRACDLYINTALSDGMSPSIIEAIASGIPVVGFDIGGARDMVEDGITGFLVKPKDFETLAFKIIYFLNNPDLMKEIGVKARKKAEREFDINERILKILTIYNKVAR